MKSYTLSLLLVLTFLFCEAQNDLGKSDDKERISLSVFMPEQAEFIPESSEALLRDRVQTIMTQYGLSGNSDNSRFIVVPKISVLGKEVTATAPSMTVLSLQLSLYIGDGFDGTKFAVTTIETKGVGQNETKAYTDAIKKIKTQDQRYEKFITLGKNRIIEYYNSQCDFIIKKGNTLADQDRFDEAIYHLSSVPEVSKECFSKAMDAIVPIYRRAAEKQCKIQLEKARAIWASGQNYSAAEQVASMMDGIDPNTTCYAEVKKLVVQIQTRVKELDKREWQFKLKQQQDEVDIRKSAIRAARDIGVAYGNNQPKTVYNTNLIRTWW
jgi:hypothetical protein